jgi:hypothetical protein
VDPGIGNIHVYNHNKYVYTSQRVEIRISINIICHVIELYICIDVLMMMFT